MPESVAGLTLASSNERSVEFTRAFRDSRNLASLGSSMIENECGFASGVLRSVSAARARR